jgi:asparagine synthase (glutamine-hydrolysing)
MCGICGIFQLSGRLRHVIEPAVLDAMTDVMTHRGPDDRGTVSLAGFALGVRRLSIVDVAGGHQPVTDETGSIFAVQNGELYNHVSIRHRLEGTGHRFHSRCDTEILPHLYEEIGERVPEELRGKFGLAVWDARRRLGIVARDRLGVKPVYYAEVGDLVIFASELKAVLASGLVPLELDAEAIDAYLTLGFVPAPLTPLRAVRKLPPGHRLTVGEQGVHIGPYWEYPEPLEDPPRRSDEEWAEILLETLDDAVASRMMSDVPLGAMLSGGLDSSLVVALMSRRSSAPVKTFSVGFSRTPDNELDAARAVARAFGADHHELELSIADPIDLDALVWTLDEPLADLSAVGFGALSALAARHVKVALSGQGADELLAGYDRYRRLRLVGNAARVPAPIRTSLAAVARHGSGRLAALAGIAGAPDPVAAAALLRSPWRTGFRDWAARGELAGVRPELLDRRIADRLPPVRCDALGRALVLDGRLGLVDDMLHYFDRTSMAHSLEVRVPFLDHRVVELCAQVPSRLKLDGGTTKVLLRRAAAGVVPDWVLDRPKVGFFSGAVDHWFRSHVVGVLDGILLDPAARYGELVDPRAVVPLLRAGSRTYDQSKFLLSVLMLELWLTRFLPHATRPAVVPSAA